VSIGKGKARFIQRATVWLFIDMSAVTVRTIEEVI